MVAALREERLESMQPQTCYFSEVVHLDKIQHYSARLPTLGAHYAFVFNVVQ